MYEYFIALLHSLNVAYTLWLYQLLQLAYLMHACHGYGQEHMMTRHHDDDDITMMMTSYDVVMCSCYGSSAYSKVHNYRLNL